ncbi:hypothetical protein [Mycobacterium paragordonae]|uniref:hypothetical protein n=1 Tax=Mycobacterium paragordonae TaxID=1389713 RepID=UPI001F102D54|nr:hypothetical protein [Mycobacterium paragordonae]
MAADLAALIEAEEAAAAAEARAAQARRRALELRRPAADVDEVDENPPDSDDSDPPRTGKQRRFRMRRFRMRRLRRLRRPRRATLISAVAVLCTVALLAVSTFMVLQHNRITEDQQRAAEFAGAARQVVLTLMSIEPAKAKEIVQHILDSSTGSFHDEFQRGADAFVKVTQSSKAATVATVQAAAVQSMTAETAVVLVSARTALTGVASSQEQPHAWRLRLTMTRVGGHPKMSGVEFIS